ncbi:MAG: efflux RND transporter periplasmic adaptor subunit [Tannerella sp.]|jgi:RND family efflux transporter MFP subunit|nr:efflux RND transporter periplasmic adaptor subunit [Tannerella sp.]
MRENIFRTGWALVALACVSCGRMHSDAEPIVRTAKIDTVHLSAVSEKSVYPGQVCANTEVNVSFRIAGAIERIPHAEGTFVRRGTVIAELDARDYRVQLAAVEAEYQQVKAAAERVVELYHRGSATKSDYEKAVYGLEQITAKYDYHKNQLTDTRLTAPFDGYIREKLHKAGETVAAGMPVISMIGAGEWQVEINLPVREYARRNEFERFDAVVSTAPDTPLPLEVIEMAPKGNAAQLYRMRLRIRQSGGVTLAAGMSAEVTVTHRKRAEAMCEIPVSALFERADSPHVWIFTSEEAPLEARPVHVGEVRRDGYLVVTEGLREGERVVTAGVHAIRDGMKVKPLPPVSPTNVGGLL